MNPIFEFFYKLFDSSTFQRRQTCVGWWDELIYMHVGADLIIWLSYMAIPVMLIYFIRKRPELPFPHIFKLFGAFILACGTTHLLGMLAFFHPMYRLDAVIKIGTALVSAVTAIALIPIIPRFLALRSPEELEREVAERRRAEQNLQTLNHTLETRVTERTTELSTANERLEKLTADLRRVLDEQARLTAILEATPDFVATADPEGRVNYLNSSARKLFNISPSADLSRYSIRDFHDPEMLERVESELIPKAIEHSVWTMESKFKHSSGGNVPVSQVLLAHRNSEGKVAYLSTIARDLSAIKQAEEERYKMELQVRHVQRLESLGVLAGGIAHDFNNLLMIVLGHADMGLSELPLTSPVRTRLKQIETLACRAAELTHQMLAYSGKGKFTIQPIDLNAFVEEMIQLLEISVAKTAELKLELQRPLPMIEADASQIRQVLMNLITNASEAIGDKPGMIMVSTSMVEAGPNYFKNAFIADPEVRPGPYICIEVSDTGSGMDLDTMSKIFDPFYTTKFTGRGLGLAAVLGIVRGHNGAIAVYSEVGKGTTFRVHFPPMEGSPISTAALEAVRVEMAHNSGCSLVVDDDKSVRDLVSDMLQSSGYKTLAAADGAECVQLFQTARERIVCVVLDATMPRMSGMETFAELRKLDRRIPILVVSGFNERMVSSRSEATSIPHFLQKPFAQKQLLSAVRKTMEQP